MKVQKPIFRASVALLILLLGIAASLSLMGWKASGFGTGDVGIAGAGAMVGGVVAGIVLCVGLLTVVFAQRSASDRPVVSPPSTAMPRRQSEPH